MTQEEEPTAMEKRRRISQLPASTNSTSPVHTMEGSCSPCPILVVLNDEPCAMEACPGVSILAAWDLESLVEEFDSGPRGFFILAKFRSLSGSKARELLTEISAAVRKAARASRKDFEIVFVSHSIPGEDFLDDHETVDTSQLQARIQDRRFPYRVEAAFVALKLGIQQPPLSPTQLKMDFSSESPGGLIIAESCTLGMTAQIDCLISKQKLHRVFLNVESLSDGKKLSQEIVFEAANEAGQLVTDGEDVLVVIVGKSVTDTNNQSSLAIEEAAIGAFVLFLRMLVPTPRYLIFEGSTIHAAGKGLNLRRARICGQGAPGVSLWRCINSTSKFPSIPCASFPMNLDDHTFKDLVESWAKKDQFDIPPMEYQLLGNSGLKISRVVLGCMGFGNPQWEGSPWVLPINDALPLLKQAYDAGINTWETADTYSNGESETVIGKALEVYKIPRSKVVIMTKVFYPVLEETPNARPQPAHNDGSLVNQMGLSRKHIFHAVEDSLRRLNTTYIDVLQLHRLDRETSPEEIMGALHDLVRAGKVHYLGASSMYTWQFARLQYTAKMHGWTQFTSMSGLYNLLYREEEREMVPFCESEGIGLIPWSPIARGLLTRPFAHQTERSQQDTKAKKWFQGHQNEGIIRRVEKMASKKKCSMPSLAIAWLLHKKACPIVGLNSASRIERVSEAFLVRLSDEDMIYLEELYRPLEVQAM